MGSLEERRERDADAAKSAQSAAASALVNLGHFRLEISGGFTGPRASFTSNSAEREASLRSIQKDPFQAMVEVEVLAGNGKQRKTWYANVGSATNEIFQTENGALYVLSWTHPGFQLALTRELDEEHHLRSNAYTLKSVCPFARARFKSVTPDVQGLYEPGGLVGARESTPTPPSKSGLKAVKLHMTPEQVDAFVSKMDGFMMIFGAPGTGKTTVAFQRVRFLIDQQELRDSTDNSKPYKSGLTAIFLANENLISYSKTLLSDDLQIPADTVRYVPEFIHSYLDECWDHKQGWRIRQRNISKSESRAREAFFHLCRVSDLKGLWRAHEKQIRERVEDCDDANWIDTCEQSGEEAAELSQNLLDSLSFKGTKLAENPTYSECRMDSLYMRVRAPYEALRKKLPERARRRFDERFARWLLWVYDPATSVKTYFTAHTDQGKHRIQLGTGAVLTPDEVVKSIRKDWDQGVYGPEEEAWLAWLLRFSLPEAADPNSRFREVKMPIPLPSHPTERRWTHVVVDEAQDLSVEEASFLSSLVHPGGALTVSADWHQVVSPVHGMTDPEALQFAGAIRSAGSTIQFPFRKNMRQSHEIGRFLKDFYQHAFNELAPFDAGDRNERFMPQLIIGSHYSLISEVKNMLRMFEKSTSVRTVSLILLDEDADRMAKVARDLQVSGVVPVFLDGQSLQAGKLTLTTVERAKGLEFDACMVLGLDDVERSSLNFWKNRAYVALSRPTKRLFILCERFPSLLQKVQKDLYAVDRLLV